MVWLFSSSQCVELEDAALPRVYVLQFTAMFVYRTTAVGGDMFQPQGENNAMFRASLQHCAFYQSLPCEEGTICNTPIDFYVPSLNGNRLRVVRSKDALGQTSDQSHSDGRGGVRVHVTVREARPFGDAPPLKSSLRYPKQRP